jgi:type IX secretion system PorP/SprF family membrane protein
MQAPVINKKLGFGLNIIHDKIDFEKQFCMYGDFSYLAQINKKTKFRIGLKGGFINYTSYDNNYLLKSDEIDLTYQERINKSMLNVGVGGFLYSDRYCVGFSVPKIINNKFKDEGDSFALSCEQQHYYLMSGLVFKLGRNLIFKPATLAKDTLSSETGGPEEIDVTANFLINERLWLGASYRTTNSIGFMAQWIVRGNLRLGYVHDMLASNLSSSYNSSHEIMVSYELASLRNSFGTPRYF